MTLPRWTISTVVCALGLVLAAVLGGCSASSPRFRSEDSSTLHRDEDEDESRYASSIQEAVRKEDDRKVDIPRIRRKYVNGRSPYKNETPPGLNRDMVLLEVVSYLGVPYCYGGNSKAGIDCSGFASAVYAAATERRIPRSTREMYGVGTVVGKDDLEFGDLVFFNTTGRRPSHVGIYLEDDLFAHASLRGVTISSLESTYYRKRYLGARRIVE
jgi:cell wall-associated NlpC family hydrolase